jgi:hypothetical protein
MKPILFHVEVNGQVREVELTFGTDRDLAMLTRRRSLSESAENSHIRDALEFSRLAAKRWRYYRRSGLAITSVADLHRNIRRDPHGEFGMMLLAKPAWRASAPVLGFCFARRSWCHHLIVDFLGVHARVLGHARERVHGVGTGILYQLVQLADEFHIRCVWGEATVNSAGFYERALGIKPVSDHFFIEDEVMAHCRRELRHARQQALAKRRTQ